MSSPTSAQLRKIKKPQIERRRRDRINKCLQLLKKLVIEATDGDPTRLAAKMEKAEILEMTVAYLSSVHQQQMSSSRSPTRTNSPFSSTPSSPTGSCQLSDNGTQVFLPNTDYSAGFAECALEVKQFLARKSAKRGSVDNVGTLRHLLINHLNNFAGRRGSSLGEPSETPSPASPDSTHVNLNLSSIDADVCSRTPTFRLDSPEVKCNIPTVLPVLIVGTSNDTAPADSTTSSMLCTDTSSSRLPVSQNAYKIAADVVGTGSDAQRFADSQLSYVWRPWRENNADKLAANYSR